MQQGYQPWQLDCMPCGQPRYQEIRFESYKCGDCGHTEFDVPLRDDQPSMRACPRRHCLGPLRQLHDIVKPPRRIRVR